MSVLEDINKPMARAARKRAGLPVDDMNVDNIPPVTTDGSEYVPGQFYQQQIEAAEAAKKAEHDNDVKRLKRDAILAGIGDAFNAFHQAYANARGTKPMTTGSMSAKVRERYDKMMQDYRNNKDKFLNAKMRAAQMDEEADYKNKMYQLRLDELEEKKKNNEADRKNKDALTKSQIDANNARKLYWEAFADAKKRGATDEEAKTEAELRVKESIVNRNNASAAAYNALEEQRKRNNGGYTEEIEETDHRGHTKKTKKTRTPNGGPSGHNGGLGWGKEDNKAEW